MFKDTKGYTLIELTVVVLLIGLVMSLTVPRFRYAIVTDELKATTRRMVGMIKGLRDEAVRDYKVYILHFDLESNEWWIDSTTMTEEERARAAEKASSFPQGVRVLDVWLSDRGKRMTGQAAIQFNQRGYIRPSAIHLGSEDGRAFTILLNPFLGNIKVYEKYVEFEQL